MREQTIQLLGAVIKVDLVYETSAGNLTPFFDMIAESPLMHSEVLRDTLRAGIKEQTAPFLWNDGMQCYFAALHAEDGFLFMGPMCHGKLRKGKLRQMFERYQIKGDDLPDLPAFTLPEMRNMVLLANSILENGALENEDLLHLNRLIARNPHVDRTDQTMFLLREEEENDDAAYRHSYHEEEMLMQAIREGRSKDAIRIAERMDLDSGRLSKENLRHRRNLGMIGIALCARAAISGGLTPETAYRISGYYIQKTDVAQTETHLLQYRNMAIEEMADRVAEKLNKPSTSNYVEQCRDYVRKHYREKIYLEDLADALGLSPTYVSRIFKKETEQSLQEYINEERVNRAANLLRYSDLSLSEIAQYVHFPNQSYFGRQFKKFKNMTPREFRDRYKPAEFREK